MAGPGHVRHAGAEPYVAIGELHPPSESARLDSLWREFERAGVTCEIPADIRVAMWEKFIFIASISGVGAVTRLPIGAIRVAADSRAQLKRAISEMVAVGRAHGVPLPNGAVAKTLGYIDSLPPEATASMQRDIMAGLPSELEAQNGAVVRLGRAVGVATPTHDATRSTQRCDRSSSALANGRDGALRRPSDVGVLKTCASSGVVRYSHAGASARENHVLFCPGMGALTVRTRSFVLFELRIAPGFFFDGLACGCQFCRGRASH